MLRVIHFVGMLSLLGAMLLLPQVVHAQPGRQDPVTQPVTPVPPAPFPPPAGYGGFGQPQNYSLLTFEERRLLREGEISVGQTIGGGLVATWLGFGIGHAVQGRYGEVGWMFTVGEGAAVGGILIGAIQAVSHVDGSRSQSRNGETLMITSFIALGVIRIWDIIDAFAGPSFHNEAVRAARYKAYGPLRPQYGFFVAPTDDSGGVAGLTLRF